MSTDNLQQRYNDLVSAVLTHGGHFRKAHGEWVRFRLDDDPVGVFLELDSWNRQLILKRGSGEYDYYGGFAPFRGRRGGDEVLGIDFGGFALYISPARLATYERLVAARPTSEAV